MFSVFYCKKILNVFRQFEHNLSNDYESCQKLERGLIAHKTGLSPPVTVILLTLQVGASDMAHICKSTSGLVLIILRCQDSASHFQGHEDPLHITHDTL